MCESQVIMIAGPQLISAVLFPRIRADDRHVVAFESIESKHHVKRRQYPFCYRRVIGTRLKSLLKLAGNWGLKSN